MFNTQGNSIRSKVLNSIHDNNEFSNINCMNSKNEQSKIPFKSNDNYTNILYDINKKNILSVNKKENEKIIQVI